MPEVYGNDCAGTVTSGGTDAPSPGTVQTWTVNVTVAFPVTSATAWFHAADAAGAAEPEKILVTSCPGGTGSQTWTVTRGAESSPVSAHTAGFTIYQVVTAGAMSGLVPLTGATFTGWTAPAVAVLSQSGGSVAVDASRGNVLTLTLSASGWTIAAPASPVTGQRLEFQLTQDGTGSRTVTWAGGYTFTALGTPVLSTSAGATDRLLFEYRAGTWEMIAYLAGTGAGRASPAVVTLTDAATTAIDASAGNVFEWALGGSHTLAAPANPASGQAILIDIAQPPSGGPYVPSFTSGAGGFAFGTDGQPAWSTAASKIDEIAFRYSALKGLWLCQGWKLGY